MCACGGRRRLPRFGLGQLVFTPVQIAADVGSAAGMVAASGMGPVDWFLSTATNLIYNVQGHLSPGQVTAQVADTNNQIAHAGEVAKASGADPATIDAIVRDYQSRTQALSAWTVKEAGAAPEDAPLSGAHLTDKLTGLLVLGLAGVALIFALK